LLKTTVTSLLVLSSIAHAAETETGGIAKVIAASPSTTFEGKKIPESMLLETLGSLKTGSEGGAKIKFIGNDVVLDITANSEVKIIRPKVGEPNEVIELVSGMLRAKVGPLKDPSKERAERPVFTLRSRTVTMGVRGTDFVGIANPVLEESEIVVFSGTVDFTSVKDPKDTKEVPAGHWGGIGGRFGKKTHDLIKLPGNALTYFDKVSKGEAYSMDKPTSTGTPTTSGSGGTKRTEQGH